MSVLNQSGEEQVECPLCMEPLEVDDLNFYPCTCLYQICRFCWHRIRTDENGLCPACRKAYPEDPADFKPLSQEEVARMKAEKRQKDHQRKQKITENRKHLANVRVVQRNLVFVVGLPMRLADADILKKHEYFGKYGKIHKVVINQSTAYAGSQGPSASAYVTYQRAEDALRAIQSINNIVVDSRIIKTSLGTTKYCSHFMKNQSCPKQDCMYLHELGDPEASFTKEQMQQGKHQEFEKKLHEQLLRDSSNNNNSNITNNNNRKNVASPSPPVSTILITPTPPSADETDATSEALNQTKLLETSHHHHSDSNNQQNKEAWPSLSQETSSESTGTSPTPSSLSSDASTDKKSFSKLDHNGAMSSHSNSTSTSSDDINIMSMTAQLLEEDEEEENQQQHHQPADHHHYHHTLHQRDMTPPHLQNGAMPSSAPVPPPAASLSLFNENASFFSSTNTKVPPPSTQNVDLISNTMPSDWSINGLTHLPDVLPPVHSTEDWQAAFGFITHQNTNVRPPSQQLSHSQQHSTPLILANCLDTSAPPPQTTQQMPPTKHISRHHDDDLGFDPFHETQIALAEMIEKEERLRLNNYQQQQQQHQQQQTLYLREKERLTQAALHAQSQLHQHHNNFFENTNGLNLSGLGGLGGNNTSNSLFGGGLPNNKLNTSNNNIYTNALSNCTKLLDNFCLGSGSSSTSSQSQLPPRSRYPPPPGFSQPNIQLSHSSQQNHNNSIASSPYIQHNGFSPKLIENSLSAVDMSCLENSLSAVEMTSKLLPFVHHQANASVNFQHSLNPPAPAWDWSALDPAIMSAGQHCDFLTTPPPPGFTLRQTLDNF